MQKIFILLAAIVALNNINTIITTDNAALEAKIAELRGKNHPANTAILAASLTTLVMTMWHIIIYVLPTLIMSSMYAIYIGLGLLLYRSALTICVARAVVKNTEISTFPLVIRLIGALLGISYTVILARFLLLY